MSSKTCHILFQHLSVDPVLSEELKRSESHIQWTLAQHKKLQVRRFVAISTAEPDTSAILKVRAKYDLFEAPLDGTVF